jgi:hypothetical protein
MANYEIKKMSESKDIREMDRARIEAVNIGGMKIARYAAKKGWSWSSDIKPIVKTEWCEASHLQYQISGRMHFKLKDGTEFDVGPGDVYSVPPGHDAWVVGDEPAVGLELTAEGITRELSKNS